MTLVKIQMGAVLYVKSCFQAESTFFFGNFGCRFDCSNLTKALEAATWFHTSGDVMTVVCSSESRMGWAPRFHSTRPLTPRG